MALQLLTGDTVMTSCRMGRCLIQRRRLLLENVVEWISVRRDDTKIILNLVCWCSVNKGLGI